MSSLWNFSAGPQLFYRYKHGSVPGAAYVENKLESYSSRTIGCLRAGWSMCYFFSPIIMIVLYRRGLFTTPEGPPYLAKVIAVTMGVYYMAHLTRGIGRMSNQAYKAFETELRQVQNGQLPNSTVRRHDFSFTHWPVDFSLKNNKSRPDLTPKVEKTHNTSLLYKALGYVASRTFGRWLLYPGSTSLLNSMIEPALIEGRTKLIQNHNGQRHKLETYDGNHIDSLFIDRRHVGTDEGNILVITSEGNAAFYEAGCMDAPLSRGYSILGWNHPGFGSSTGKPHPDQEHAAIDTVIQFALEELKFPIEQIVFMSWSIGGFSSTWAAANYPQCKALILDATFDDVLPLAKNRMPKWMDGLVETVIREYFDLDNAKWLKEYHGPVRLIRRTQDEMIALDAVDVRTNRGNYLLLKLLIHRYPQILNSESQGKVMRWLSFTEGRKEQYLMDEGVNQSDCRNTLLKLSEASGNTLPLSEGDELEQSTKNHLALYLADKYMVDMVSTHCVPLPAAMFELPWQLNDMTDTDRDSKTSTSTEKDDS